jgi:hypothetical protein
MQINDMESA